MSRSKLITAIVASTCVVLMASFVSYANAVGRDTEREVKIKKFSLQIHEKTRLVADQVLSALRQNVYAEVSRNSNQKEQQQKQLQLLINYERLSERKETADSLKIADTSFYDKGVIGPGKELLEAVWSESHKKNGSVCDISRMDISCYPEITKGLADLSTMKKELAEMKGAK